MEKYDLKNGEEFSEQLKSKNVDTVFYFDFQMKSGVQQNVRHDLEKFLQAAKMVEGLNIIVPIQFASFERGQDPSNSKKIASEIEGTLEEYMKDMQNLWCIRYPILMFGSTTRPQMVPKYFVQPYDFLAKTLL